MKKKSDPKSSTRRGTTLSRGKKSVTPRVAAKIKPPSVAVPKKRVDLPPPAPPAAPIPPSAPVASVRPVSTGEPSGMLDYEELPETYGVNEVGVLAKDAGWLLLYWEVTDEARRTAAGQLGSEAAQARLVLRLDAFDGPTPAYVDIDWNHGRRYLRAPPPGTRLRVQVGLIGPSGQFAGIAESAALRVPRVEPGPWEPIDWMEVDPSRTRGREFEGIRIKTPAPTVPTGFRSAAPSTTSAPLVGGSSPWIRWPSSRRPGKPQGGS